MIPDPDSSVRLKSKNQKMEKITKMRSLILDMMAFSKGEIFIVI